MSDPPDTHSDAGAGESPPATIPATGMLLGIDYGTKRIGVAACDRDRLIASPVSTEANDATFEKYIRAIVAQSPYVGIVVGLPLHANGDESDMSRDARKFAAWLSHITALPAVMWDERYTSFAAENVLLEAQLSKKKRKARVDRVAAQMILQTYIDTVSPTNR